MVLLDLCVKNTPQNLIFLQTNKTGKIAIMDKTDFVKILAVAIDNSAKWKLSPGHKTNEKYIISN